MACGLPVIGARTRAFPEYISKERGFLVEPGDYKALAQKIVLLLQNPTSSSEMGLAGVDFLKNFSISRIGSEWEKLYQNVSEGKVAELDGSIEI